MKNHNIKIVSLSLIICSLLSCGEATVSPSRQKTTNAKSSDNSNDESKRKAELYEQVKATLLAQSDALVKIAIERDAALALKAETEKAIASRNTTINVGMPTLEAVSGAALILGGSLYAVNSQNFMETALARHKKTALEILLERANYHGSSVSVRKAMQDPKFHDLVEQRLRQSHAAEMNDRIAGRAARRIEKIDAKNSPKGRRAQIRQLIALQHQADEAAQFAAKNHVPSSALREQVTQAELRKVRESGSKVFFESRLRDALEDAAKSAKLVKRAGYIVLGAGIIAGAYLYIDGVASLMMEIESTRKLDMALAKSLLDLEEAEAAYNQIYNVSIEMLKANGISVDPLDFAQPEMQQFVRELEAEIAKQAS